MRLAIDARILYYPKCGIGNYVFNLVKNILILDDSIEIYLFLDNPIHPQYQLPDNPRLKKIIFASSHREKKRWIQKYLPIKLKECKIDIYHATWNWGIPFFKNCPTILTIHDLAPWILGGHFKNKRKEIRYKLRHFISAHLADLIVTDSFTSKEDIIRLLKIKDKKIKVVYLGVDEEFNQEINLLKQTEILLKYNLREKKYLIDPVGIEHPRRNPLVVLEGCYDILKRTNFKLVYTGSFYKESDEYKKLNQRIKELMLEDKVLITGWLFTEELSVLIRSAKIAIIPSLYEGFGLTILECFSCRVPVVASDIKTIHEIAKDAVVFFNPYDYTDLLTKLMKLLEDNNSQLTLIDKGIERLKYFSWQKTAEEMLQIYKNLLQ